MSEELMTIEEVADYLKVSKMTVQRMIRSGQLPSYRIGGRAVRLKRAEVDAMVQAGKKDVHPL